MLKDILLGSVTLRFKGNEESVDATRGDLSAVAIDEGGNLWVASDEKAGVERLRPTAAGVFEKHRHFDLTETLELPEPGKDAEIDIEGMSVDGGALWVTGSHTSTRKKPKGDVREALARLAEVRRRPNRYVVGRIPISDGKPRGDAAYLPYRKHGNVLTKALRKDPHLGSFLHIPRPGDNSIQLASKENGFDIEGLAARGGRVLLGLRGPVLRGWAALILEIAPEMDGDGELALGKIGHEGRPYRKHFVDLEGMGVRDLCWSGNDLLILAGPTMDLTGNQTVWRLRDAADLDDDSISDDDSQRLERLFDLPSVRGADKAEGLELYDGFGEPGVLVVYDSPSGARMPDDRTVHGDVFRRPAT